MSNATWHRYEDHLQTERGQTTLVIEYLTLAVLSVTSDGVWLERRPGSAERIFVRCNRRRMWAHPTERQALASYLARKRKQAAICQLQLSAAQQAINIAESMLTGETK